MGKACRARLAHPAQPRRSPAHCQAQPTKSTRLGWVSQPGSASLPHSFLEPCFFFYVVFFWVFVFVLVFLRFFKVWDHNYWFSLGFSTFQGRLDYWARLGWAGCACPVCAAQASLPGPGRALGLAWAGLGEPAWLGKPSP